MAGLNIPGVTDQYNTNDTVEKLMKIERVPLTREQNQLESLKTEKNAWRDVNSKLSSLRDNTKTLYSFENPFNSKLTSSSEEYAVTAEANRSASIKNDTDYLATISDGNYYPSPALFVYTLPNIVTGEIAIRHHIQGETSFYVLDNPEQLEPIVQSTLATRHSPAVILTGWCECSEANMFNAKLQIIWNN